MSLPTTPSRKRSGRTAPRPRRWSFAARLRALGSGALLALSAGGLAALIRIGWVGATRRRLDGLAAVVGGSFVLLLVVSLLAKDPRILLARESVLTGAAGVLLVGSCVIGRPVLYALVRRLSEDNGELLARWDQRWRTEPSFRRHFLVLSMVLGSVLLAESAVRLVLIVLLPVDVVANLSLALHVGAIALLVCWGLLYRARRLRAVAAGAADDTRSPAETTPSPR